MWNGDGARELSAFLHEQVRSISLRMRYERESNNELLALTSHRFHASAECLARSSAVLTRYGQILGLEQPDASAGGGRRSETEYSESGLRAPGSAGPAPQPRP